MLEYLKGLKILVDLAEKVKGWQIIKSAKKIIKPNGRNAKVLVLGPGGVGKTSVGKFLSGENKSLLDLPSDYITTLDFEDFEIESVPEAQLEIAPGQQHRLDHNWSHIKSGIESGEYEGMIFVVSYGYHSIGDIDYKTNPAYEKGNKVQQFLIKYIKQRQRIEIDLLKKVSECLKTNNNRFWVLVFVGKMDLWWRERDDVEPHYLRGEFSEILKDCSSKKNDDMFRTETIFGSLEIQSFKTGRGVELSKNAAGYGQAKQATALRELIEMIKALVRWKHGN